MGIREEFSALNGKVEQVATDVKWLVDARKQELEDKRTAWTQDKDDRRVARNNKMWLLAIFVPCIIAAAVFFSGMIKNVDILCALHRPQMEIFQQGGKVVDSFKKDGIHHGE